MELLIQVRRLERVRDKFAKLDERLNLRLSASGSDVDLSLDLAKDLNGLVALSRKTAD